jgi:hypothetical protein
MNSDVPLSQLAESMMQADASPRRMDMSMGSHDHAHDHHQGHHYSGWVAFVFYFLVLSVLFYYLYFALRPYFVLKQDDCYDSHSRSRSYGDDKDEIDNGRLLGAAVVTALILIFVFWVFGWFLNWY